MAGYDDGWEDPNWDKMYVEAFDQLDLELARPLDQCLEEPDLGKYRPKIVKHGNHHQHHHDSETDDNLKLANSEDEEEDVECRKSFFHPPLQFQRNQFVKQTLLDFRGETFDISKLCMMGCGEMSLERSILEDLGSLGTKLVLSVDFEEESLARGSKILELSIKEKEEHLKTLRGLPILMRSYLGNILHVDNRFANADAIVSLEVIEHMELADARQFVSTVLGILRPRIFIFSTPNHDYNQAFGDKPGEFRHDDHKFEMRIGEFEKYLEEIRQKFPEYQIEKPKYIGQIDGFKNLKGATQVAVCKLEQDLMSMVEPEYVPFKTVGQMMVPIGMKPVEERLLKQAFLEWIKMTEFRQTELLKGSFSLYWLIDIKKVLHHLHAPITFASRIDEIEALKMLKMITKSMIQNDFSHGFNAFTISSDVAKDKLIRIVEGK